MKIVEAKKENFSDVYNILHECSLWLQNKGMDHWIDYYSEDLIKNKFNDHTHIFLLEIDGRYVGTISVSILAPEYYIYNQDGKEGSSLDHTLKFTAGTSVYISALGVLPEYQGKGCAKDILSYVENYAKENSINFLRGDARGDYTDLINMYLRWGFKKVGSMPDPDSEYFLLEKKIRL